MSILKAAPALVCTVFLTVALPASAVADDDVWDGPGDGVNASVTGNEAQVTANQQTSSGGSQAQPQPGYDADVRGCQMVCVRGGSLIRRRRHYDHGYQSGACGAA